MSADPGLHDLCGEPVAGSLRLGEGCDAVALPKGVGSSGEEERGGVRVEWLASLEVSVVFGVEGVVEQGPAGPVVVLDVGAGVEQVAQQGQVFDFDSVVCGRGCGEAPQAAVAGVGWAVGQTVLVECVVDGELLRGEGEAECNGPAGEVGARPLEKLDCVEALSVQPGL